MQGEWNCRAILIHGRRAHGFGGQFLMHRRATGYGDLLRHFKRLHTQLGFLRSELSAGKATGIAGIVHDPHAHVALLRLQYKGAEKGQILRRHIRERHIEAGLHGDRLEAEAMQGV